MDWWVWLLIVTAFATSIVATYAYAAGDSGGSWWGPDTRPIGCAFVILVGFLVSLIIVAVAGWL